MGCQEDAEYLGGSRVAWRAPSRKDVAEQLGGQQVARGAELRVAKKGTKQLRLRRPVSSGRRRVCRASCSVCGAVLDTQGRCCVRNSVSRHHSITKQVSFVVKREQRIF